MTDDESIKVDRRIRLDHMLTWLVSGILVGLCTALLWVHQVDKLVASQAQEMRYLRERMDSLDIAHVRAVQDLAKRFDRFEEKLERIAEIQQRQQAKGKP